MIDAKDLRIGNLIYIDNGEKPIYRYQITAHDIEEIEGNGKDCFEILLTDDFLLNAGFKELNYGWYAKEYFTDCMESAEVMSIQINLTTGRCGIGDTDFGGCNAMTGRVIKYVHQLQNLVYFLTGSELEIVW